MAFAIGVLATMAPRGLQAQSCTTTACTSACLVFDDSWNRCTFDYVNKGFDTLTSCVCQYNGLSKTVMALAQCTSCQQDGLGSNSLARYEVWTVICNTYENDGEASALEVGNSAPSVVLDAYTESYLPYIQSAYCGSAVTSTMIITSDAISTMSEGSGGSTTTARTTPRVSGSSITAPTPTPTSNEMSNEKTKLTHVVGIPLVILALLGFAMH